MFWKVMLSLINQRVIKLKKNEKYLKQDLKFWINSQPGKNSTTSIITL